MIISFNLLLKLCSIRSWFQQNISRIITRHPSCLLTIPKLMTGHRQYKIIMNMRSSWKILYHAAYSVYAVLDHYSGSLFCQQDSDWENIYPLSF